MSQQANTQSLHSAPPQGVRHFAGLDQEVLLAHLSTASHIVLHAALYSNFAKGPVDSLLKHRLAKGDIKRLALIKLEAKQIWRSEFFNVLRPGMPQQQVEQLFSQSRHWCAELKALAPAAVELVSSQAMPLQPVLLLDDVVLAGQYAHSQQLAACGLWLELDTLQLGMTPGTLQQWFIHGAEPTSCPWQQVVARYADECHQAAYDKWMQYSLPVRELA